MNTCIGTLDLSRGAGRDRILETVFVGGNARQRRRKIRLYKGNGWTVRSWLRRDTLDAGITIDTAER